MRKLRGLVFCFILVLTITVFFTMSSSMSYGTTLFTFGVLCGAMYEVLDACQGRAPRSLFALACTLVIVGILILSAS
jgi:hypothetical protein